MSCWFHSSTCNACRCAAQVPSLPMTSCRVFRGLSTVHAVMLLHAHRHAAKRRWFGKGLWWHAMMQTHMALHTLCMHMPALWQRIYFQGAANVGWLKHCLSTLPKQKKAAWMNDAGHIWKAATSKDFTNQYKTGRCSWCILELNLNTIARRTSDWHWVSKNWSQCYHRLVQIEHQPKLAANKSG